MTQRYQINDIVSLDGFPTSKVVGIDWYTMRCLNNKEKTWPSYTLTSDDRGPFARWWITDEKAGLFYWEPCNADQIKGDIVIEGSGLCFLKAEGNTISSSDYSSVAVFKKDEELYAMEAFEKETLYMKGTKINIIHQSNASPAFR